MPNCEAITSTAYDMTHLEYMGLVECVNDSRMQQLREYFARFLPEKMEEVAVVAVGSDGKGERHGQSRTELVIVTYAGENDMTEKVSQLISSAPEDLELEMHGEKPYVYRFNTDEKFSFVHGNNQALYPDFLLNSKTVVGNEVLHQAARLKVLHESVADDEDGKRIRKHIMSQRRTYRAACKTGVYGRKRMFDESKGEVYYFEKEWILGFKITFLRLVQRHIDYLIVNGIRTGLFKPEQVVAEAGTSTIDKLGWLASVGMMEKEMADQVEEAYLWFLMMHHKSQEQYLISDERDEVAVEFDIETFTKHKETILTFSYATSEEVR